MSMVGNTYNRMEASKPMGKDVGSCCFDDGNLLVNGRSKFSCSHSQSQIHVHSLQTCVGTFILTDARGEQTTKDSATGLTEFTFRYLKLWLYLSLSQPLAVLEASIRF